MDEIQKKKVRIWKTIKLEVHTSQVYTIVYAWLLTFKKGGKKMDEEREERDVLNQKLGMAEIQGRFVNLDELSVEEIDKMLEIAKKNEKEIREQINALLKGKKEELGSRIESIKKGK